MRRVLVAATVSLLITGLSCGDGDEGPTGPEGPADPTTGSILVSLMMSGADMDDDGCTVTVDGGSAQRGRIVGCRMSASRFQHAQLVARPLLSCRPNDDAWLCGRTRMPGVARRAASR